MVQFVTAAVNKLRGKNKTNSEGLRTFSGAKCSFGKLRLDLARFTAAAQKVQGKCGAGSLINLHSKSVCNYWLIYEVAAHYTVSAWVCPPGILLPQLYCSHPPQTSLQSWFRFYMLNKCGFYCKKRPTCVVT